MTKGFRLTGLSVAMALLVAGGAWALTLARDGATAYDIVISRDMASPSEKWAAEELAQFLNEMTGAAFPVVTDDRMARSHHIFVGDSAALRKVLPDVDLKPLGREGYIIRTVGPHLVLAGGRQRGSMYAVYGLLEDVLGCRWFTPTVSRIPKRHVLQLPPLNIRYIPPLEYREPQFYVVFDGTWNARNRMNGFFCRLKPQQGDKIHYKGFVHTFYALVPPSKYFKDHPEYFALVNGKRVAKRAQLCLTNPDVLRIATETVRRWLREARAQGLPEDIIVSVSQNDCWGWCQCPKCTALAEKEGSQSGPILHFVNAIADAIRDEFPLAAIDTLAYSYSRKPPRHVRPRPNVIVRLCSIECCFSHPLATCPANKSFMDDLRAWSKICKRLYIWDYTTNYAHYQQPFPNLRVLRPNIRTFVAHNVRGIFEEGNYHCPGEFSELRSYLLAKFLWNPDYPYEKALTEFLEGYYGPAAPYIRQYIDLLHDTVEREQIHVRIYSPPTQPFLRDEILDRAEELFERAMRAVAGNEELELRVRRARMPIDYVRIATFKPRYRLAGDVFLPADASDYRQRLKEFLELARRFGMTRIREGETMEHWSQRMPRDFPPLKLVRLESKDLKAEVIPGRGGRIFRLFDRCLYRNIMHVPDPASREYPSGSGYVDFVGVKWPGPGANEPWRVLRQTPNKVVMEWSGGGYKMRRTIALDLALPAVDVAVQAVNVSGKPRETVVRLHPSFRVGRVDDCIVEYKRVGDGRLVQVKLADMADNERDIFLRGAEMPAGRWVVWNTRYNFGVRAIFDPREVGQCLLNYNRREGRVNLELYSAQRTLKPGEAIQVKYRWEMLRGLRGGQPVRGFGRWDL